jgi:hypothetical protein
MERVELVEAVNGVEVMNEAEVVERVELVEAVDEAGVVNEAEAVERVAAEAVNAADAVNPVEAVDASTERSSLALVKMMRQGTTCKPYIIVCTISCLTTLVSHISYFSALSVMQGPQLLQRRPHERLTDET